MRLKKYYKRIGGKRYGPYFVRYDRDSARHIPEQFYLFFKKQLDLERKEKEEKRIIKNSIPKSCYNESKELLEAAGYRVRGQVLHINLKSFFTLNASTTRYDLLSKVHQDKIGSASKLQELSSQAWSLHKRCNARQVKNTFLECLKTLLKDI
jgi:hypothetical protein